MDQISFGSHSTNRNTGITKKIQHNATEIFLCICTYTTSTGTCTRTKLIIDYPVCM